MEFEEIVGATRSSSGFQDRARVVIEDPHTFAAVWAVLEHGHEPKTEPPAVSFFPERVIVAAMGARTSGGYSITIEGAFVKDGRLFVVVHERSPGADCVVTQAATQPVTVVQIDVNRGYYPIHEIVFVERQTAVPCAS